MEEKEFKSSFKNKILIFDYHFDLNDSTQEPYVHHSPIQLVEVRHAKWKQCMMCV
jgi:hypothetical protein